MDYRNTLIEYKTRLTAARKEACASKEAHADCPTTDPDYIRAEAAMGAYGNTLTWLDEAEANASPVEFASKEHRIFFHKMLETVGKDDCFYSALFYTLGILRDTRSHINDLYDFENGGIKVSGLKQGWQTSGSYSACLLAFNLFNGYMPRPAKYSTPYELFEHCDSRLCRCMLEAIKIRHYIH